MAVRYEEEAVGRFHEWKEICANDILPPRHRREVAHGNDFTFAGTEVDLRQVQPKMREQYGV